MSAKPKDDVREALRACTIYIRQTNDAIRPLQPKTRASFTKRSA